MLECPQNKTIIVLPLFYHIANLGNSTATGTISFCLNPIIAVKIRGKERGEIVKLNQAVSVRLQELLHERGMTQYQLYLKSGVPKSTIGNLLHCSYDSVKLRVLHELCQGLGLSLSAFFSSPLFEEDNLEP